MKGFPEHLNTKKDYEYIRNHFPESQWRPVFQALLDEKDKWMMAKKLAADAVGVTDKTHKVVENETAEGVERYQYEYKEDPNCKLLRLGFAVKEIERILIIAEQNVEAE